MEFLVLNLLTECPDVVSSNTSNPYNPVGILEVAAGELICRAPELYTLGQERGPALTQPLQPPTHRAGWTESTRFSTVCRSPHGASMGSLG
jgi:hypothetical protein